MTISYPITLPTSGGYARVEFRMSNVVGVSTSPFTLQQQLVRHQGARWEADITVAEMERPAAEEWIAALASLRGAWGTFRLADPGGATPRGTWAGTPLVKGAGQTGETLLVDGFSAGATIKAGDYFQIGDRLYKVLVDATESSGEITIDIWPRLRESPADNAVITTSSAKGLFRLASNTQGWALQGSGLRYTLAFGAVEAI
jgi:hypothetical protein